MKITAQEEYGIRILLRIARFPNADGITINEISKAEGLTVPNVAKLCRILRLEGFIKSSRGQFGGYTLAKAADEIKLNDVIQGLGGKLFESKFCEDHTGVLDLCRHSVDCSIRSLWQIIQNTLDDVLGNLTLKDLMVENNDINVNADGLFLTADIATNK